ncbi:MAG: hypothetical protein OJI67_21420 [Prosthecobacter sp.]|nr:hypothetical protein [Prosthecobacter sp.]
MPHQDETLPNVPAQTPAELEASLDMRLKAAMDSYVEGDAGRPADQVFADLRS